MTDRDETVGRPTPEPGPGNPRKKAGVRYLGIQAVMFWTVIPVLVIALIVIVVLAIR
jgi:hypothetical protein